MNILYLHGFASYFDPNASKVKELSSIGTVYGFDIDYTQSPDDNIIKAQKFIKEKNNDIDLIVGCSLGGWLATKISEITRIPFVALNPSVYPNMSLYSYQGKGIDYRNKPYELSDVTIKRYTRMSTKGNGLIFLNKGDEVLNAKFIYDEVKGFYPVFMFKGGDHRFSNIKDVLPFIQGLRSIIKFG